MTAPAVDGAAGRPGRRQPYCQAPLVCAALFLAATVGCGGAAEWTGTIEERDGVVYVENPAAGLWDQQGGPSVHFELEQTFGADTEPADEILAMIGRQAFDVDDEGNVYIFDGRDERLVAFAPDGSLRWSAGGPGQGPAEFDGAEGMAWNGASTIYVTNANGARVDFWTTDGDFVESRSIEHLGFTQGSLVGVLDEHTIVLQTWLREGREGVRVGVIDLQGEGSLIADFDVDTASGSSDAMAIMEVEIVGEHVVVGDRDSYDLRFYDRTGELRRVVRREFEHLVVSPSQDERRESQGAYRRSWLKPPLPLPEGRMLAMASWSDPAALEELRGRAEPPAFEEILATTRRSFDFFDAEGRYLTSVVDDVWEGIGGIDEVDASGNVYASVSDPYPHVRRFRVIIEGG